MTVGRLKNIIKGCLDDIIFTFNGKPCGVTSEVHDFAPTFQVWFGDVTKEYNDIDELMNDPFFDGNSLNTLIGKVSFTFA